MAAHSLEVLPCLLAECEWNLRSGLDHTLELLDGPEPPTAIAAASAQLALGALAAARSRGLSLPGDLAIASFDDTYFAPLLEPALTAISYDTPYMGERSARLLVNAIEAEEPKYEEVRIAVKLIQRRSCGCDYDFMPGLDAAI